MSFDWSEYLKLAQELAGQPGNPASQEARLRAAVSRAYYAVFCMGRNYLREQEGRQVPSRDVHRYVRDAFKKSPDRLHKQIGYDLDRLRSDRNKADYDDSVANLDKMANAAVALAHKIIRAFARL